MSELKVVHEVKLQKSVVIILGVIAAGVFFNAFGAATGLKSALADSLGCGTAEIYPCYFKVDNR